MRRVQLARSGFTLVEVAVTLVIVGVGLTLCLQSLQTAKLQAAHTRNLKLARELGVMTLGQIEAGLFQQEITDGYSESYAGEGYPDFYFEVLTGEEQFEEPQQAEPGSYFDAFAARRQRAFDSGELDEDEDVEQPFEKVRLRVTFPQFGQYRNYLVLESWMPWDQVHGADEDEDDEETS